jgi:hypothetical protein
MARSKSTARKRLNTAIECPGDSYFKGAARDSIEQVDGYAIEIGHIVTAILDERHLILMDRSPLDKPNEDKNLATLAWHHYNEEWLNHADSKKFFRGPKEEYPTRLCVYFEHINAEDPLVGDDFARKRRRLSDRH